MRFLSGAKNKNVVVSQRNGIGGKVIQFRLLEAERRLNLAPGPLLAQDVGDVVGAERAGCVRFAERGSNGFRSVFANQIDQFANLTRQGAVRVGKPAQIFFRARRSLV
jgi:hypothetical protein